MSGTDTSRGINFQYASAISVLLDLVENTNWEMIQLEGKEDIEDILIFNQNKQVVERIQIKQKRDPYQWKPSEFRDIILAFAELDDNETVLYRVIYSGSEGSDVYNLLKPSLLRIQMEGWQSLSLQETNDLRKLLGDNETAYEFLEKAQQRFKIEKHDSWAAKRIKDLERIRTFFRESSFLDNAIDWDAQIYSRLFETIAMKNEGETNYLRQITKADFHELLGADIFLGQKKQLDREKYFGWLRENALLYSELISLLVEEAPSYPDILNLVIHIHNESDRSSTPILFSPLGIVERFSHVLLCGESGSGKTSSLWQIVLNTIEEDGNKPNSLIPVYINLASYDGERIHELIRNSIASSGQQITDEIVNDLSKQGSLMVLLDDYDYCRSRLKQDLQLHLKSWLSRNAANKVVIISHNASDGANLDLPTFKILPLSPKQSSEILSRIDGINKKDITNIQYGRPPESDHFLNNPLLLKMLAYYYIQSDKSIPKSRGPLYQRAVEGIMTLSEGKGFTEFGRDLKLKLLAMIAAWMQNNNIYSIAPSTISNLLYEWSSENTLVSPQLLRDLNHPKLVTELIHSGLFQFQLNGNIQFIHSTFKSFLAAYTINENILKEFIEDGNWHSSVLFWASRVPLKTSNVIFQVLDENFLLLGQLINERAAARTDLDLDSIDWVKYFEKFCDYFISLARNFPILLAYKPWNELIEKGLELLICNFSDDNVLICFCPGQTKDSRAKLVDIVEIERLQQKELNTLPLSLFLLPKRVIAAYHPLELSYIWILRALFDSLYFFGQASGVDVSKVDPKILPHPAFGLLLNRFVVFQGLCLKLPSSIQDKLPFYATKPFSLVIELHAYAEIPFVRYAVVETMRSKSVAVVPVMYSKIEDVKHLINLNKDGTARVMLEKRTFMSALARDLEIGDLYMRSAGAVAQSWLRDYLQENLSGFPPKEW